MPENECRLWIQKKKRKKKTIRPSRKNNKKYTRNKGPKMKQTKCVIISSNQQNMIIITFLYLEKWHRVHSWDRHQPFWGCHGNVKPFIGFSLFIQTEDIVPKTSVSSGQNTNVTFCKLWCCKSVAKIYYNKERGRKGWDVNILIW